MEIDQNVKKIKAQIGEVTLIAAAKGRTIEEIQQAISAGIAVIGENYVHEAAEKFKHLQGKVSFHLIGHLQRNKVRKAIRIFDMIQSLDSFSLAVKTNEECAKIKKIMPVLIEINIAEEKNKTGCSPAETERLAASISKLPCLEIKGLMVMGPSFDDPEKLRPYFRQAKILFDKLGYIQ